MVGAEWDMYVDIETFVSGIWNKYKGKVPNETIAKHLEEFVDHYKKINNVK